MSFLIWPKMLRRSRIHGAMLFAAQCLALLALIVLFYRFRVREIIFLILGFVGIYGFGISTIFHRQVSHASWRPHPWIRNLGIVFGSLAIQGSALEWAAIHRAHHAESDTSLDPHSPTYKGFWRSYVGSMFCRPDLRRFSRDLGDQWILRTHRWYWSINIVASVLACTLLGFWEGLAFHLGSAALAWQATSVPKVLCHLGGEPRDVAWLSLFTFGESLHRAHHEAPARHSFSRGPSQIDPGAAMVRLLKARS